mgnify:CR=1 FL=1
MIGIQTMLTPLEDRIDRWATSGKATRILIHAEDYIRLSDTKREKMETKYGMPIEILGGDKAVREFLSRNKNEEKRELESLSSDNTIAVNLSEVEQGDE